jgi:hypothetical protein
MIPKPNLNYLAGRFKKFLRDILSHGLVGHGCVRGLRECLRVSAVLKNAKTVGAGLLSWSLTFLLFWIVFYISVGEWRSGLLGLQVIRLRLDWLLHLVHHGQEQPKILWGWLGLR